MATIDWGKRVPMWVWSLLILGIVGSAVALLAGIIRPDVNDFTAEADGVVSMVETTRSGRKNTHTSYVTHVRFADSDHRTFEAQSIVNGDWRRHEEGDKVVVRYDPRDPEAGVLIVGDEDKLESFNGFIDVCRYGGMAALLVAVGGFLVTRVRMQ